MKNDSHREASRAQLTDLFDRAPVGYVTVSEAGKILEANLTVATMLGVARAKLIGESLTSFIPPEDMSTYTSHSQVLFDDGEPQTCKIRMVRPDTTTFWVLLNAAVGQQEDGTRICRAVMSDITELKQAEDDLPRSEERRQRLFDTMSEGVFYQQADGTLTDVNDAALRMFGVSREEFLNRTSLHSEWDVISEDGTPLPGSQHPSMQVLRTCRPVNDLVVGVRHPLTRAYTWVSASGIPEFHAGETAPYQVVVTMHDITERKQIEQELRESEMRYKRTQQVAKVGSWEYVLARNAFWGSDEARRIYGLDQDNVPFTPEAVERCIPDRERVHQALEDLIEKDQKYDLEFEINPADGSAPKIIASVAECLRDKQGNPIKVIGAIQDITARKQADEALRASEAKIRGILDNIGIGVALISTEMEILELNRQMQQWFPGIEAGQRPLCYRSFNYPPRDTTCEYCPTVQTLQDGQVHEGETQTPTPNGIRNYRIVSSPILGEEGQVVAAIELVEDVTEKTVLEFQLHQAQKMESVGRLAGGVAHDFNNMLGVILGHAGLALELEGGNQPLRNSLLEIRKAAERSADLTRQLLAFARRQTVSPKALDLNDSIGGMLNMLRRLIGENISLDWRPRPELWLVQMDPSQIDQIVANLCVNARDAINGVGQIIIETGQATFDAAGCAGRPGFVPGEFVRLAIRDSGAGMDPETLSHIFEPFFTTKGVGEGTGLGLATVYGAVKQNNGFIEASSEPGQGTLFEIYLPRYRTVGSLPLPERGPTAALAGDETILLVEDEPAILAMITLMLENLGYRVLAAGTPGEAIRQARHHGGSIELLLTDVVMPEMNGRDLAKNVLTFYPEMKRLFMSGYTADVIAHQGVLDADVHFIQKPFTIHQLAEKIREALNPGLE